MTRKIFKLVFIGLSLAFNVYAITVPLENYYNIGVIRYGLESIPWSINFGIVWIFFITTYFIKNPFKYYHKIGYAIFGLYIFVSCAIVVAGHGTSDNPNEPHNSIIMIVTAISNLLFGLWCILITPFGYDEFINWPFERREDKEIDQNE